MQDCVRTGVSDPRGGHIRAAWQEATQTLLLGNEPLYETPQVIRGLDDQRE